VGYVLMALVGFLGGGICVFVALQTRYAALQKQKLHQGVREQQIEEKLRALHEIQLEAKRFQAQAISYKELQDENLILRRDLHNLDIQVRKLQLDGQLQRENQETLDKRSKELGARYLKENVKWLSSSLNQNNYAICKQRLQDVIERCRSIGFDVS
jgi:hypothetical protein